jgi:hypothetical protein
MAVHTEHTEIHERVLLGNMRAPHSLSWGGVWSGFLVAIGAVLLLSTLGLAVGISSVDVTPEGTTDARGLGTGAAIWSALTLLVALFIGGMVATRSSAVHDRAAGMIEGVLVWVLSMLTLIYLATSGIGLVASGGFGALRGVTQGAATATVGTLNVADLTAGDAQQILTRLNDPQTIRVVAAVTGTSQAEARTTLADIRRRVEAASNDPQRAVAEARDGLQQLADRAAERVDRAAARAQPYASATLWSTLAAMLVALVAAVAGAMAGRRQVEKRLATANVQGTPIATR